MITVHEATLPGQVDLDGQAFPLVLACRTKGVGRDELSGWIQAEKEELLRSARRRGAVLFRGFPLVTVEDFDSFVRAFELPNFPYDESLSNAVRVNRTERVFTANEAPPSVPIFLHHEMAQTPIYPSHLFFFCEQAAESGGATPLCRSDILWQLLRVAEPQFAADCQNKGLKYTSVMPSSDDPESGMGRSWQRTLRATRREQAEARLKTLGYAWKWREDDCLEATTPPLPATMTLPDGRTTFFNQLIAAFQGWRDTRNDPAKAISHGDGSPLNGEAACRAAELAENLAFPVPWRHGDVALVDNFVTMHGRQTFQGTRKVLASLVKLE